MTVPPASSSRAGPPAADVASNCRFARGPLGDVRVEIELVLGVCGLRLQLVDVQASRLQERGCRLRLHARPIHVEIWQRHGERAVSVERPVLFVTQIRSVERAGRLQRLRIAGHVAVHRR